MFHALLGVKTLSGTLFAPPLKKPGYGARKKAAKAALKAKAATKERRQQQRKREEAEASAALAAAMAQAAKDAAEQAFLAKQWKSHEKQLRKMAF